jgi:hypothetical protein
MQHRCSGLATVISGATVLAASCYLTGGTESVGNVPSMATPPPADVTLAPSACVASGQGTDYQVGPSAGQLSSLDEVPWESLKAGDTVRIFHRATPYLGKFLITASGTAGAPVRVCGVKGPNGERPIISGAGAVTRKTLVYGGPSAAPIQESRAVVMIKADANVWTATPSHVQVDGLAIRSAHPEYTYTDTGGVVQRYASFGACVWIDRGHDITLADNEISDCTNGVFSKSTDDGDFAVTKNIRLAGNHIHGNGVVGDDHEHNTYMQSVGIVYEFNHYGPPRMGALGNAIKDRSVGTVVRYNRLEEGARALDLVEAEDFPSTALANAAYRTAHVYGNQIVKTGDTGSFIHYGGDHQGSTPEASWGEPIFRRGTLYFYNNTVHARGRVARLFQLSTTLERAEVWNNVFFFEGTVSTPSMRASSEVGSSWTAGGILNLGRNWISSNWADSDPWHPVAGQLSIASAQLTGASAPIDLGTLAPLAGSPIIDAGLTAPSLAAIGPPTYQLDARFAPVARTVNGAAIDIGAVEH